MYLVQCGIELNHRVLGCGFNWWLVIDCQGFFQDFRQEGANMTIVELRGGMYNCCIFQGFCNVIAHS